MAVPQTALAAVLRLPDDALVGYAVWDARLPHHQAHPVLDAARRLVFTRSAAKPILDSFFPFISPGPSSVLYVFALASSDTLNDALSSLSTLDLPGLFCEYSISNNHCGFHGLSS
jgi:hypothetical protein